MEQGEHISSPPDILTPEEKMLLLLYGMREILDKYKNEIPPNLKKALGDFVLTQVAAERLGREDIDKDGYVTAVEERIAADTDNKVITNIVLVDTPLMNR